MVDHSKILAATLFFLLSFLLAGCDLLATKYTQEETYKKKGVWYEKESDKPLNGSEEVTDANGFLRSKIPFKDGLFHGVAKSWHEQSHAVAYEISYVNGKKHGPAKAYSPSGYMTGEETYEDGKQHGESRSYRNSGDLESLHVFEHGEYVLMEMYDSSGAVMHRIEFENGDKSHEYTYRKGKLQDETIYTNGIAETVHHHN